MANPNRVTSDVLAGTGFHEAVDAQDFELASSIRQRVLQPIRDAQEHERIIGLELEAKSIADEAQAVIGVAYQSPHTRETARQAARIALGLTQPQTTEGEQ